MHREVSISRWDTGIEGDIWYTGMTGIPPMEAFVTSAGGSLKSIGTTLNFPTGAVVTDTLIILTPQSSHSVNGLFPLRSFDLSAKHANDGDPITTFALPYTITVQYTDAEMGPVIENTLALYWWNGVQWMREPTSNLDAVRNQITAHPDHMTIFAVLGEAWRVYLPIAARW